MRITIVTDAWKPQVNGVVRTLERLAYEAGILGDDISFVTPAQFKTMPLPFYPEISLSLTSRQKVAEAIKDLGADALHISTEGPLGHLARSWAVKNNVPFTSCYHTHYPHYISARFPIPEAWTYAYLRWFHSAAQATMVATEDLKNTLKNNGFKNLMIWSRGVDGQLFKPRLLGSPCVERQALQSLCQKFLLFWAVRQSYRCLALGRAFGRNQS